jgi:acetylornithine deacetylase/succinyl-diaminopimelate desuccinylase-like protein
MANLEKFKEHAKRILSIPSHAESGNEELVRYYQTILQDFGFKTQLQQVNHSNDRLSKRQFNLIGFSSDNLVDRSTRRGSLFINPIDVTTGNLPHLWTATQGNPQAPVTNEMGIVGSGAVQGKLDYLCRIFGAVPLLDRRHKNPVYLVGACASHYGMMGSRFLIESLSVNPKEVYTFAPTQMVQCKQGTGQVSYTIDIDSAARDRDTRGYNRSVEITAFGVSIDFSTPKMAINAFELIMDLLIDATANGFDFQWSNLETRGAEGTNPDIAKAQIFLTAFQFEDFKQFIRTKLNHEDKQRFFRVDYTGVSEVGTRFIPPELMELVLELDFEWKNFTQELNQRGNPNFDPPENVGALTRIVSKNIGKLAITFEMRFLPNYSPAEIDERWKAKLKQIGEKYKTFHFSVLRDYVVQGLLVDQAQTAKNVNYLSDAGWFVKGKFPVSILGAGSVGELPKGPNEAILWSELEEAIQKYQELMNSCAG